MTTVYKSGGNEHNYLITLEVVLSPENSNIKRNGVSEEHKQYAVYRCKTAKVIDIYHKVDGHKIDKINSHYDSNFIYKVGEIITDENYDIDINNIYSEGIHFFLDKNRAIHYNYKIDGEYESYYDNGIKRAKCVYKNQKLNGKYISWYHNNEKMIECTLKDGLYHGQFIEWTPNGNKRIECFYKNGLLDGLYILYNDHGNKMVEYNYKESEKLL